MSWAYYNENDPYAAQHLRNLIADGLIPAGDVDERSIVDVRPSDLDGYVQHHFFAGIGIWTLALRMAGWPDDRPVCTGSCPCQPFSGSGKGGGFDDERHLWPSWHWLIQQRQFGVVFGEQVESPAGRAWFDLVCTDMEGLGYACGAVDQPSAGYGAPNIRQRLFWVADSGCQPFERRVRSSSTFGKARCIEGQAQKWERRGSDAWSCCANGATDGWLGNANSQGWNTGFNATTTDRHGHSTRPDGSYGWLGTSGPSNPWRELEWLDCRDGRRRPTQPGLFPLATRNPGDVGQLRTTGNAINPWAAAAFISAYLGDLP